MKALSVKNPFATLTANGIKKIEVRSYNTYYRGPLLICASAKPEYNLSKYYKDPYFAYELQDKIDKWDRGPVDGKAVCVVDLVACFPLKDFNDKDACLQKIALDENFPDKKYYGWHLDNVRLIEPFEVKGQLGFFNVPDELIIYEQQQEFPAYLSEPIFKEEYFGCR